MTFLKSINEYTDGQLRVSCHVCGDRLQQHQSAIVHDGKVYVHDAKVDYKGNAYGSLHLHAECATILMLRLAADVMRQSRMMPNRVVDSLAKVREASQDI